MFALLPEFESLSLVLRVDSNMHSQVARKCLPWRTRNVTLDIALRGSIITRDITDYSFETVGNAIESWIAQEEQQHCRETILLIIHNFPCTCSLHKY